MRASLAAPAADQMSGTTTWMAWGLAGAFFTLVALPLASSSPYPTPSRPDWSVPQSQVTSASTFSLASASSVPVSATAELVPLVTTVKTLSIKRPIGDESEADQAIVTASVGAHPTAEPAYGPTLASAPSSTNDENAPAESASSANEIDQYLWEVYQRQPAKKDRGGDFSWKDPAAAKRMGKTLQSYVIVGMDADFRELVYAAGKAMDAAGIEWTIVSGFRDDWRQSIASGIKARTGYSRHGGSVAVGGYGHGRAVDVGHVDKDRNDEVWRWIDSNGAKFGLHRPYRFDPPHVEPRVEWRRLASNLRRERTGATEVAETETRDDVQTARAASAKRKVRVTRVASYSRARPARARRN
jgi:hypothetical protein